jgi:hypothetical protein
MLAALSWCTGTSGKAEEHFDVMLLEDLDD